MVRTQVSLTEEQYRYLKELSRDSGVSLSSLVREAVDLMRRDRERARRRAIAFLGSCVADRTDVARRHDDYFAGGEDG